MVTTNPKRILIADDNQSNVILLDRLLRQMGYETTPVYNGQAVIEAIETAEFDLVLLDVMMPDITGFTVLQWIRERYNLDQLPVILISALIEDENIIEGLELGANDYITKPIQVDILQRRVETQIKIKTSVDKHVYVEQQLKETTELQNRLMRIASHDLKNPLANIKLAITLLETDLQDNTILQLASEQTDRMENIIHEFLELELIKHNTMQVNLSPMTYQENLIGVIAAYEAAAAAKGITIQCDLSDEIIYADKNRLEQVLSNLVSNAVKYAALDTTISIWDSQEDDMLTFYVQNIGEAIKPEEMNKLFQPFSKMHTRPTGGEHSSGLGLWIVHQMMEAQHGEVGIDPDFKDGARFWVRLPLYQEELVAC
ncbi:response regulator [Phototrophicus methaneseepsis]|uniref:histidine kinase n=1 Tax=Phototrophicus methaneseepsis TaxID=2710758 RepID=A0A7S8EAR6_9CHLR|nr:response regulator [Phototrophicus methaneseepsis]QPC83530.1 response regulator [Phototrophicus methaneseepsis]